MDYNKAVVILGSVIIISISATCIVAMITGNW